MGGPNEFERTAIERLRAGIERLPARVRLRALAGFYTGGNQPARLRPDSNQPADFHEAALGWVAQGVQIIGGCCGIELEYIEGLRNTLPARVPGAAQRVVP